MDQLTERLQRMTPLQRAVFALKETQARLEAIERRQTEPIAIVGMACRFPGGANDPTSFWRLLCDGVDAIREVPPDRWKADEFYDPDPAVPGKMNTRWGGFLERIDEFDNHFFSISDREAARMDPQQRILLELAWEAMEDAGLPPSTLRGAKVGVFVGIAVSEYGMLLSRDLEQADAYVSSGNSLCIAANRLSFVFDLQGPSVALDTACSSSLVALHLACHHIRSGECEGALVGGSHMMLTPAGTMNVSKAGFCAPDGRVRAFDAAARGYVRSEGAGMVMLKPLSAALQNKDPIYAVIRGSAVNQNGSSNGLTAPSRAAQEQVVRDAYARSRVSPGQVRFVETQGTGTRLGDTIEALALGSVLRQARPPGSPCALGALKTNFGHMEAASGIASLMKAALALKHRQLPPNLNFETPNPDIPFAALQLEVPRKLENWPDSPHPRLAGVNAFGFGGSNAHVVLEEPPAVLAEPVAAASPGPQLLPLSARTESALHELARRYRAFLRGDPPAWSDVCYTAAARRDHQDCRLAVVADTHEQAAKALESYLSGQPQTQVFAGRKPFGRSPRIAFLYSGCTEIWKPLVSQLAKTAAGFGTATKQHIDAACQRVMGWSLAAIRDADPRWNDPAWAQPALLALQLALTAWWRLVGIVPNVVLGQGVGELAAAVTAGILTNEEALHLVVGGHGSNRGPAYDRVKPRPASLPLASAADGKVHPGPDLDAAHWRSCLTHSGSLAGAMAALGDRQVDVVLEVGPGSLIDSNQTSAARNDPLSVVVPSLRPADDGGVDLSAAVGTLYAAGADLLWPRLAASPGRCVRVPTYSWQRQRFWALGQNWVTPSHAATTVGEERTAASKAGAGPTAPPAVRKRPDLTSPYVAPRTKLEADMIQSWSAVLRVEGIGVHDNFFALGGDSLQATMLLNRLQEHLGEAVPGHVLFRVQTVGDLADYLRRHCPEMLRRQYPDEPIQMADESSGDGERPVAAGNEARGSPVSIPRLARDRQTEDLLERLDELTDEEVESLFGKEMADREAVYE